MAGIPDWMINLIGAETGSRVDNSKPAPVAPVPTQTTVNPLAYDPNAQIAANIANANFSNFVPSGVTAPPRLDEPGPRNVVTQPTSVPADLPNPTDFIAQQILEQLQGGLSPYGISGEQLTQYDPQLRSIVEGLDLTGESKPQDFNIDDLITQFVTGEEGKLRTGAGTQVSNVFTPTYAQDVLPTTLDDVIIDSILSTQRAPAEQYLNRYFAREGIGETDPRYTKAFEGLGSQEAIGRSTLQRLGGDIITSGRGSIEDIINKAVASAGDVRFGGPAFDPTAFTGQAETFTGEFTSGLEGALRGAAGGSQYFNPQELIGTFGQQGATALPPGTGRAKLASLVAGRQPTQDVTDRRLGSTGAF